MELGLDLGPTVQVKLPIAADDRVIIFIAKWWRLWKVCVPFGVPCIGFITKLMAASQEGDIPPPFSALGVRVALCY